MCVRVWCVGCVCACVVCVCAPVRLAVGQNAILGLIATYSSSQWKGKEFCTQGPRAMEASTCADTRAAGQLSV